MPLVVGIDEAGYGPTLGPLVVAASVWRVAPAHIDADYWQLLRGCVVRSARRGEWRVAIDDSKQAYDRKSGIHTLERSVLAVARVAGLPTHTLSDLLGALGADVAVMQEMPWYARLNVPLPLGAAHSKYEAVADRLSATMDAAGARCIGLAACVVGERRFNQRIAATRNKAAVLLEQVLRLIDRATGSAGDSDVHIHVDRLGGRSEYRSLLAPAFPDRHVHELAKSESSSRYRLASERSDWHVDFSIEADQRHMPVALASMTAKYVREALMTRFNAFWRELMPALRPTAGYYVDAQRFLADIEPVLPQSGLSVEQFVRAR